MNFTPRVVFFQFQMYVVLYLFDPTKSLAVFEEKLAYQLDERIRDMHEMVEDCHHRVSNCVM